MYAWVKESLRAIPSNRSKLVARRASWNIAGQIVPMATAIICVPLLIAGLGNARFAGLTLVWTLLGYFSLFDFGVSRALTYRVSQLLGNGTKADMGNAIRTGLGFLLAVGLAAALLLAIGAAPAAHYLRRGGTANLSSSEVTAALLMVSAGIPVVMLTAGLRGILEARGAFGVLNSILIPAGIATFVLPIVSLGIDRTLVGATAAVLIARALGLLGMLIAVSSTDPEVPIIGGFARSELKQLLGFGVWVAIGATLGPLMVFGDRFLLATLVPLGVLAFYTAPFDVLSRMTFVSSAIMNVLFPMIVQSRMADPAALRRHYRRAVAIIAGMMTLVLVAMIAFSLIGMRYWLGESFARESRTVAILLSIGVTLNGIAMAPLTMLQALGRPSLTAKLYMIELPLYLGTLAVLAQSYSITGAAAAWTIRAGADCVVLFALTHRLLRAEQSRPKVETSTLPLGIEA